MARSFALVAELLIVFIYAVLDFIGTVHPEIRVIVAAESSRPKRERETVESVRA